jgi:hypothetical protein
VKHYGVRKGFFNPPLFAKDDVSSYLEGFDIKRQVNMKSGIYFEAAKA